MSERSSGVLWAVEVLDALTALNAVDRAVLRLIYWRGVTHMQAARELHVPEQVIRQCVARGMRDLAAHLAAAADSSQTLDRR